MPLRTPNDTITPLLVLTALQTVMPVQTRLTPATIFLNSYAALSSASPPAPCMVLHEGQQSSAKIAWRMWQRRLTVLGEYFDRWDTQQTAIAAIWETIDLDLRRAAANVEDNPTLTIAGVRNAIGVVHIELSPYYGEVLSKQDSPAPIPLVKRAITLLINIPPYAAAA